MLHLNLHQEIMKVTKRVKKEFQFLLNTTLDMIGNNGTDTITQIDPNGLSALECYFLYDSQCSRQIL